MRQKRTKGQLSTTSKAFLSVVVIVVASSNGRKRKAEKRRRGDLSRDGKKEARNREPNTQMRVANLL